jgi:predicted outer membrane repeat protein
MDRDPSPEVRQGISQGGKVTLRSAIVAADEDGGSNTIDLSAGTYQLTIAPAAGSNGTDGETGELPVTSALTIDGAGSASTIVEAGTSATNGISKVFSFNPLGELDGFAVSLTGLTIQYGKNNDASSDGDQEGGAFDFDAGPDGLGSLTMNDVVVNQNSTTNGDGGGIALFDGGVVSITDSEFTNNTANGDTGGGIYIGGYYYGTVPSTAKLTITGSTISGNKTAGTYGSDGGGILSDANFPVVINDSTISDNKTTTSQAVNGGGIADEGSDGLTIGQDTVISGNSASHWGGGLYSTDTGSITDATISNNFAAGGVSSQSKSIYEDGGEHPRHRLPHGR